jgi:hypothetical protein
MKHVKRKFANVKNITQDVVEYVKSDEATKNNIGLKNNQEITPHLITEDGMLIQGFFAPIGNKLFAIAEPNITVIYFSNAQGFLSSILKFKNDLEIYVSTDTLNVYESLNITFNFYSVVTSFISSLCNSLEAFVNSQIPKSIKVKHPKKKKSDDKWGILRYWSIEDKVNIALEEATNRNFIEEHTEIWQTIIGLLSLRNDITHAKADPDYEINYYQHLYIKALSFDYLKSLEAVKELMNYYETGLIEACNCGKTH